LKTVAKLRRKVGMSKEKEGKRKEKEDNMQKSPKIFGT